MVAKQNMEKWTCYDPQSLGDAERPPHKAKKDLLRKAPLRGHGFCVHQKSPKPKNWEVVRIDLILFTINLISAND